MFEIWHPLLMESTDRKPLATEIKDLTIDFPYDRIPKSALQFVLRPECVVILLGFYLVSKPIFLQVAKFVDPKASWFVYSIAFHNFLLAVFSIVVAAKTWPIVFDHYER